MIQSLSSLRFVFAVMVFLIHIHKVSIAIGHAFFIVLSGFILTMVYEKKIVEDRFSFSSFFKKRIARTYPIHILTLFLALPLALESIRSETGIWVSKFILNLLCLQVFVPINKFYFSFNGVSWNLAVLMIFYACFPWLIRLLSNFSFRSFSALMIFIVLFISCSMYFTPEHLHHYLFYISPFYRIFDFIFGIYLFRIAKKVAFKPNFKLASFLEIKALIICVLLYILATPYYENTKPYIYSLLLWIPLAVILLVFYYDKGIISKYILGSKLMLVLGGLSFSFYMIHQLVIRYFLTFNISWQIHENIGYFLCFLISLILAYLSHIYFERLFYKK